LSVALQAEQQQKQKKNKQKKQDGLELTVNTVLMSSYNCLNCVCNQSSNNKRICIVLLC